MTANPSLPEITRELLLGQTTPDRPDLVARVFHLKVQVLLLRLVKTVKFVGNQSSIAEYNMRKFSSNIQIEFGRSHRKKKGPR